MLFRTGLTKALFCSPAACLSQLQTPLRRKRVENRLSDEVHRKLKDPERTSREALELVTESLGGDRLAADLRAPAPRASVQVAFYVSRTLPSLHPEAGLRPVFQEGHVTLFPLLKRDMNCWTLQPCPTEN